ncbi:hypothetical protein [Paenibacillus residui]|uniref:Uncharacterized protein n=1 Tax=Paenibacillus residui TaxID=629724 RepID=A0ABW3DF40_9BACL
MSPILGYKIKSLTYDHSPGRYIKIKEPSRVESSICFPQGSYLPGIEIYRIIPSLSSKSTSKLQVFLGKSRALPYSKAIVQVFGAIFAKWPHFGKKNCTFELLSPYF